MQTTQAATKRAVALGLMVSRAQAEGMLEQDPDNESYFQYARNMGRWADAGGLLDILSSDERQLYERDIGSWSEEESFSFYWRTEALRTVLWALGRLEELPPVSDVPDPNEMLGILPMGEPLLDFIASCRLRAPEEIEGQSHRAEFFNWRARTAILRFQGMPAPAGDSYEAVVQRAVESLDGQGIEVEHDGTDMLIEGTRWADLPPPALANLSSVSYERHLAFVWLCGDEEDWDQARADT